MTDREPEKSAQFPAKREHLSGWGLYPTQECTLYRPDRPHELSDLVHGAPEESLLARGRGRSYGDAALNQRGAVVSGERLNRFIDFDPESGKLHCESAVTLAEIIDTFLPRGFFFPVTPGTKAISIGGAIAADVHGKNHHQDGSIGNHLLEFRLLTANGDALRCSRNQNTDIFWATLGGMGLTGIVLDAQVQLKPVPSAYLHTTTEKAENLDETLARMIEGDANYDYSVAWIDCLATGRQLGRSVLLRANPADRASLPTALQAAPFVDPSLSSRLPRLGIPVHLPNFVLNPLSMRLFNSGFYHTHRNGETLQGYNQYFYPLDVVSNWNRIYGKRGVLQYQVLLPMKTAQTGLTRMLESISKSAGGSFLAVLKSMGPGNGAPLSFPDSGMTLALDFPNIGPDLVRHLHDLDDMLLEAGGRVYLAKDSVLRPKDLPTMYPRLRDFLEVKNRIDPNRRFDSSLARRIGLWDHA